MEYRRETNGLRTFLEYWGFLSAVFTIIAGVTVYSFFISLRGEPWIHFFFLSQSLLILGTGLIFRAKVPVYRSGRFFTFGLKAIPKNAAGYYRWGWRVFLFGVGLSLCLLLSEQ